MGVNKEEHYEKSKPLLLGGVGSTLRPAAVARIFKAIEESDKLTKLSNRELADMLVNSALYGQQIMFGAHERLLSEIINRLLEGKIPESWKED